MSTKGRVITPYRDNLELIRLRECFYGATSVSVKRLALNLVKVLQTRGKLPHAIDATAALVNLELMGEMDHEPLRHAYCSTMTRLVNGLLDPFQQASVALPLLRLAKEIGLLYSFVEIRHMATHEGLPSLDRLRQIALEAKSVSYTHLTLPTILRV